MDLTEFKGNHGLEVFEINSIGGGEETSTIPLVIEKVERFLHASDDCPRQ